MYNVFANLHGHEKRKEKNPNIFVLFSIKIHELEADIYMRVYLYIDTPRNEIKIQKKRTWNSFCPSIPF